MIQTLILTTVHVYSCAGTFVNINCDGAWQAEVSWTISSSDGTVLASGGAPQC